MTRASGATRRPGRPRKPLPGPDPRQVGKVSAVTASEEAQLMRLPVVPTAPRLLDLEGASAYLAISIWTIRDMVASGKLARIRLPLKGEKDLRKLLFDREDLDRVIESSKEDV